MFREKYIYVRISHRPTNFTYTLPVITRTCHPFQYPICSFIVSFEPVRVGVKMLISLWNLTGGSAAVLPRRIPNFKAVGKLWISISRLRYFTRPHDKGFYAILKQFPSAVTIFAYPDSKAHGANMGPIWGRQNPGGPHVGPMNLAIWVIPEYCVDHLGKDRAWTLSVIYLARKYLLWIFSKQRQSRTYFVRNQSRLRRNTACHGHQPVCRK